MVKPGYKQTEIGVLPDSWDTITFEECLTILPNNTLSRAELNYNGGEVQNIHYGDILVKFPAVLDCSTEGLPYINKENVSKASKGFLRDGDLIMADTAEDVIVGKSTEVIGIGDSKVVSGLHTIPCRPKDAEMFAPKWLGYFINHCTYHDQLIPYITGIKVSSVSKSAISSTVIAVPPKPEQEAIAEALSDIDTLIVNLEKLIAKKKAIKQGAMQELLTGKRRLPGFDGEWIRVPFQKIYKFAKEGGTPSTNNADFYINGNIPFAKIEDLECKYIDSTSSYITEAGVENSSAWLIPIHSVILSNGATIGAVSINRIPITTKQGILGIVPSEIAEEEYLYYYFSSTRFLSEMKKITTHGTMDCAYLKDINTIELFIPSDMKEQRAIVNVLSDMDSEIEKLGEELYKFLGIKQGMMSELLTGRIRLIDKEDA